MNNSVDCGVIDRRGRLGLNEVVEEYEKDLAKIK